MLKKISFIIIPLSMLACNFIVGGSTPNQNPPEPDSTQEPLSTPEVYSTKTFTLTRVNKVNGDLSTQLASEAQKAKSLGQMPFVEFDATWCPPCIAIDESIKAEDKLTVDAFDRVYLIRVDVDEWGWGDGQNFRFEAIPVYYQLNEDGTPTGAVIDGGAWNEDIPENFAPVLDAFFHDQ
jgi:thiol-disulfide isomerase/thioredoxin